jgi:hypothetical protein
MLATCNRSNGQREPARSIVVDASSCTAVKLSDANPHGCVALAARVLSRGCARRRARPVDRRVLRRRGLRVGCVRHVRILHRGRLRLWRLPRGHDVWCAVPRRGGRVPRALRDQRAFVRLVGHGRRVVSLGAAGSVVGHDAVRVRSLVHRRRGLRRSFPPRGELCRRRLRVQLKGERPELPRAVSRSRERCSALGVSLGLAPRGRQRTCTLGGDVDPGGPTLNLRALNARTAVQSEDGSQVDRAFERPYNCRAGLAGPKRRTDAYEKRTC